MTSPSKTEIEKQIDPRALDSAEQRQRGERLRVGEGRADPEETGERVLDRRLVVRFLAEFPAEPRDQTRGDLVANRDLDVGADASRLDFEDIDAGLIGDRRQDRLS